MGEPLEEWCLGVCELAKRGTSLVEHGTFRVLEEVLWAPLNRWVNRTPALSDIQSSWTSEPQSMQHLPLLSKTIKICSMLRSGMFSRFGNVLHSETGHLFLMLQRSAIAQNEHETFSKQLSALGNCPESHSQGLSLIESIISEICIMFEVLSSLNASSPIPLRTGSESDQCSKHSYQKVMMSIVAGNTEEALNHPECGPEQLQLIRSIFDHYETLSDPEENELFISEP